MGLGESHIPSHPYPIPYPIYPIPFVIIPFQSQIPFPFQSHIPYPIPYPINLIHVYCVTLLPLVDLSRDVTQNSKKGNFSSHKKWEIWFHKYSKKGNFYADHIIPARITALVLQGFKFPILHTPNFKNLLIRF